ncbi:MAG: hypothetical protein CUN51_06710 [Candidatus Thermofonsia Clade 1 bacterium]|uniref:Uncharacterized protein n=1 Tax=Candidatus Thermofonsia Clade 1 bacterium TaxID=2364210 RepID=A0A2M8NZE4_9CHLR|nr:MAG: hypothetical protein CUN51_06710 [Candidatus Thermofonsia Clade 1 bacterium]
MLAGLGVLLIIRIVQGVMLFVLTACTAWMLPLTFPALMYVCTFLFYSFLQKNALRSVLEHALTPEAMHRAPV